MNSLDFICNYYFYISQRDVTLIMIFTNIYHYVSFFHNYYRQIFTINNKENIKFELITTTSISKEFKIYYNLKHYPKKAHRISSILFFQDLFFIPLNQDRGERSNK